MGLLDYNEVRFVKEKPSTLSGKATRLLTRTGHKKKRRRGSGIKKKLKKQKEHKKLMQQYQKQKKERGQMFKDFERLISND